MYEKVKKFWVCLNRNIVVNKRESFLGMACCTLAGILTGMMVSPKKTVTIGSHNTGNSAGLPQAEDAGSTTEGA
ncbi:MAG: hypothetical protein MR939_04485 [Clostridiales bacterium]|nr:hypothetical protein [Clostridiales bacterium]MDD7387489.1 hypothetical protein [Bacillota bacterium]